MRFEDRSAIGQPARGTKMPRHQRTRLRGAKMPRHQRTRLRVRSRRAYSD